MHPIPAALDEWPSPWSRRLDSSASWCYRTRSSRSSPPKSMSSNRVRPRRLLRAFGPSSATHRTTSSVCPGPSSPAICTPTYWVASHRRWCLAVVAVHAHGKTVEVVAVHAHGKTTNFSRRSATKSVPVVVVVVVHMDLVAETGHRQQHQQHLPEMSLPSAGTRRMGERRFP